MALTAASRSQTCWPKDALQARKTAQAARPRALAGSPLAASLSGVSGHEFPKQLDRIGAECTSNRNKFDDVDAPLASFILGDKGLWPAKLLGQGLLANARPMSRCDKDFDQPGIFDGFEGFLHAPPGLRIGGKQFDPGIGLSQKWIFRPERANAGSRGGSVSWRKCPSRAWPRRTGGE